MHKYQDSYMWDKLFTSEVCKEPIMKRVSHIYENHHCETDPSGNIAELSGKMLDSIEAMELVVDVVNGTIPLWAEGVNLKWRIDTSSIKKIFSSPSVIEEKIRAHLQAAIEQWGDAAPVSFSEDPANWDFEIVASRRNCSLRGCSFAKAFFPGDLGPQRLILYPDWAWQHPKEQVDTLIHELGHIFGLRHFHARTHEPSRPAEALGTQDSFTIMNTGERFTLTELDKEELAMLYQEVWSGARIDINGVVIDRVRP